ncbi:MAG TPA: YuzD family protein [Aliicoccus persicus]|uniref:YuzD family protein n=1 Tax=Aliicoccus persicus TaxID=930138 RepID=A0A921JCI7_9STAP|nr:YuzD family protein [Aliicoccus persicus]
MRVAVKIYGRDVICASCVNAPGSKDTYEWLEALLPKKYSDTDFRFSYIDLDNAENLSDHDDSLIEQINDDELFYPLVTMNDEVVQDGYVNLKPIYRWLDGQKENA